MLKLFKKRKPDFIVSREGIPYLHRWWLIPRNKFFNVYLHKFLGDDEDRALHCHPWNSLSILLKGGYIEHLPGGKIKVYKRFAVIFRPATYAHRIELHKKKVGVVWQNADKTEGSLTEKEVSLPALTLFITGPKIREWGFLCPQGFRHWQDFVNPNNTGEVGRGCDD